MKNLSSAEQGRLDEILAAAKAADWERFSFLTDKPFSNKATMKDQFEDSSKLIREKDGVPKVEAVLEQNDDGTRLIFAKIILDDPSVNPILLTLHSTSSNSQSSISIWTFYQEFSF